MYLTYIRCVNHSSNNIDVYGHSVPKSQPYLLCNYLEKLNENKKDVCTSKKKKKKTFSFTEKLLCICWVEFEQ